MSKRYEIEVWTQVYKHTFYIPTFYTIVDTEDKNRRVVDRYDNEFTALRELNLRNKEN